MEQRAGLLCRCRRTNPQAHAAPTELGRDLGGLEPINMALLTELLLSQENAKNHFRPLAGNGQWAFAAAQVTSPEMAAEV
jgi:hypothetical protein